MDRKQQYEHRRRHPATALVVSVGERQGTIGGDPTVAVDLIIRRPGAPDRPLATSLQVPVGRTDVLVAGAELSVGLSDADPTILDIDWGTPL